MRVKLITLLAASAMLAACTGNDDTTAGGTGGATGNLGANAGYGNGGIGGSNLGATNGSSVPGSQQDLEVNVGDRVYFGYDSSSVDQAGQQTLDRQSAWLKQFGNVAVTVEGHTDERGTREYNLALGERRAAAAKAYLVASGVPASRINTVSYGEERPADAGKDENAYALNRRAVTVVNTGY
ncbi:peptidoglycan-associated lipoprotein [Arboricoccus pini]|uniref:Peptidoglycan-associated lipoprotein n=1 Tax=Arboricoccus pini TaxID=1963835 RepID=A0A212QT58_9PROT|nr:peptidoglycan-associated lipoprotein Pal [Arboricoccus pini]SNB62784.1 peptidoglycan-associated lipoprotein [Arboricoccus pini]